MWYACVYGVCSVSVVCVCVFGMKIHFFTGIYGGDRLLLGPLSQSVLPGFTCLCFLVLGLQVCSV